MSNIIELYYNNLSADEKEAVCSAIKAENCDELWAIAQNYLQAKSPFFYTNDMLAKANYLSLEVQTTGLPHFFLHSFPVAKGGWVDKALVPNFLNTVIPAAVPQYLNGKEKAATRTTTHGHIWN
jgi:hypothetical protein